MMKDVYFLPGRVGCQITVKEDSLDDSAKVQRSALETCMN